jgi:hypothetical protein
LQKVKKWLWGVYISYHKKTGEQMNIEDSCHRFFCAERELVRDTARIVLLAESKGNKGWVSLARAKPTQKRIQVSDKSREPAKILY